MSEWGNPAGKTPVILMPIHNVRKGTRRTETSKKAEEEKERSIPGVAASEMGRAQTSVRACWGYGLSYVSGSDRRMVLGKPAREGESPVAEIRRQQTASRVPRDTWNLVGTSLFFFFILNTS